jgi:hypothetical protein
MVSFYQPAHGGGGSRTGQYDFFVKSGTKSGFTAFS